jgi:methionyl-tRNA formyltransferase
MQQSSRSIVIATIKSWNVSNAKTLKKKIEDKFNVCVISDKDELTLSKINSINPRYIFFPHWSWIIPAEIYENFECVVFHPTDLPYGRGGTPIQNLIVNKKYETKISAIRVNEKIDGGDVYLKEPFSVADGSVEEILQNMSDIVFTKMIPDILRTKPRSMPQKGAITLFKRRKPEESNICNANLKSINDAFDFIRMLDGEGYPKAFIKSGNLKICFSSAEEKLDRIVGKFEIVEE